MVQATFAAVATIIATYPVIEKISIIKLRWAENHREFRFPSVCPGKSRVDDGGVNGIP